MEINFKKYLTEGTNDFIKQTAQDYDVCYEMAESIIKKYPDSYHEELEKYIKNRADKRKHNRY